MQEIIASVDHIKFDLEIAVEQQLGAQPLPFPGMDSECGARRVGAVDLAEAEPEKCSLVNKTGTENIVNACRMINAKLLYLSTDYVFSGSGTAPWKPYDSRKPINVYGKTKYEGEMLCPR